MPNVVRKSSQWHSQIHQAPEHRARLRSWTSAPGTYPGDKSCGFQFLEEAVNLLGKPDGIRNFGNVRGFLVCNVKRDFGALVNQGQLVISRINLLLRSGVRPVQVTVRDDVKFFQTAHQDWRSVARTERRQEGGKPS